MNRKTLILTLFLMAISGFLLHYRIHYFMVPDKTNPGVLIFDFTRFLASALPMTDVIFVTLFFMWRRTAAYGYLLNGMIVIFGTILMSHFSIVQLTTRAVPLTDWIIKSTLPDIGLAWADFFVGKTLYESWMRSGE